VRKQEIAMASSYIDSLAADFDPSQYTDEYRAAVDELVAAKTAGREVAAVEPSNGGGEVIDLVEALRASVQAAKEKRAGQGQRSQPDTRKAADDAEPAEQASRGPAKAGQSGPSGAGQAATGTSSTRRRTRKPA
jgi:DNA end-binding protein Ku